MNARIGTRDTTTSRRVAVGLAVALLASLALHEARAQTTDRIALPGGAGFLQVAPTAPSDCPLNYVCLWEHQDFTGAMVAYSDCCSWYNLGDAGFNNRMSSWRNRKTVDAKVADFADGNGDRLCLNDGGQNASVSVAWNDAATSIKIFSSAGAC